MEDIGRRRCRTPVYIFQVSRRELHVQKVAWSAEDQANTGSSVYMSSYCSRFWPLTGAVSSVKVITAALGGCTHFVTTASDDEDAVTTIGFAQGVVGRARASLGGVLIAHLSIALRR